MSQESFTFFSQNGQARLSLCHSLARARSLSHTHTLRNRLPSSLKMGRHASLCVARSLVRSLALSLSLYIYIYMSFCLYIDIFLFLSLSLSLSMYISSRYLCLCLSVSLSLCLSVSLSLTVSVSVCLSPPPLGPLEAHVHSCLSPA
jgi:hypothetical protein